MGVRYVVLTDWSRNSARVVSRHHSLEQAHRSFEQNRGKADISLVPWHEPWAPKVGERIQGVSCRAEQLTTSHHFERLGGSPVRLPHRKANATLRGKR